MLTHNHAPLDDDSYQKRYEALKERIEKIVTDEDFDNDFKLLCEYLVDFCNDAENGYQLKKFIESLINEQEKAWEEF